MPKIPQSFRAILMRATAFEFHHRFWFIVLIFALAFLCYSFDPVNAAWGVVEALHRVTGLPEAREKLATQMLFALAGAMILVTALLRTWGAAYLRTEVVHDTQLHTDRLVADGPFRHTRNPLYLGNYFSAGGMGLMASRLGWFVLFVGMAFFTYRLIFREEAELAASQGESYRAYVAAVPRLWPSWRPRVPSGGMKPRWFQAVVGEFMMWGLGLVTLVFLFTTNKQMIRYAYLAYLCVCLPVRLLYKRHATAARTS
jgi:protein-S-isoprenylcysteine O-methyltransferase Ste14